MTLVHDKPKFEVEKQRWLSLVEQLVHDIAEWSASAGWKVSETRKQLNDPEAGDFEVSFLQIELPDGELHLRPLAVSRGIGRIDLQARPTMNRVRFLARPEGWQIMTESHVPLRVPWSRETFLQLANDLVSWTH